MMQTSELRIPLDVIQIHDYVSLQVSDQASVSNPSLKYPNYKYALYYEVDNFNLQQLVLSVQSVTLDYSETDFISIHSISVVVDSSIDFDFESINIESETYLVLRYYNHILHIVIQDYINTYADTKFRTEKTIEYIKRCRVHLQQQSGTVYTLRLQETFVLVSNDIDIYYSGYVYDRYILRPSFILDLETEHASLSINTAYPQTPKSDGLDLSVCSHTLSTHLEYLIALEIYNHGNLHTIVNVRNINFAYLYEVINTSLLDLDINTVMHMHTTTDDIQFCIPALFTGAVSIHNNAERTITIPLKLSFYTHNDLSNMNHCFPYELDYYNEYRSAYVTNDEINLNMMLPDIVSVNGNDYQVIDNAEIPEDDVAAYMDAITLNTKVYRNEDLLDMVIERIILHHNNIFTLELRHQSAFRVLHIQSI
jgi:hypothetical protein